MGGGRLIGVEGFWVLGGVFREFRAFLGTWYGGCGIFLDGRSLEGWIWNLDLGLGRRSWFRGYDIWGNCLVGFPLLTDDHFYL